MTNFPSNPFNDLGLLPPRGIDLETRPILKQCLAARVALAELKQAANLLPNPGMLINTLPLLEAQASSEIENIVTTADRLFEDLNSQSATDPATREAQRYRQALMEGFSSLSTRPLSTRTAETICSTIKGTSMGVRKVPGTALGNSSTQEVIYTPPVGESLLRDLLGNWERFIHGHEDVDPLIRMAVAHYQFEAIHPFTDGNGRTGRVLNSLMLVEQKLLPLPILYLSRYIIQTKSQYYSRLLDVTREAAWEPWLLYLLQGVENTATWTTDKIALLRRLMTHTAEFVKATVPKTYSHELIVLIFEQPYCRIGNVMDANIAKRQTASRYLKALASINVLKERIVGRDKLYTHPKLLQALTTDEKEFESYTAQP